MLTLGIVDRRTECKAENRRDQLIHRTASICQLAQRWVVGLLTLGPNCTCNIGKETTDDSLGKIEISKTKLPKASIYKLFFCGPSLCVAYTSPQPFFFTGYPTENAPISNTDM